MDCFIGFGSLVNTSTHKYQPVSPVRVPGWSRAWINNDSYDHAFLSVIPDSQKSILGLLAVVPDGDWAELDAREAGYNRKLLSDADWQLEQLHNGVNAAEAVSPAQVQMYVHASGQFAQPQKPILYSYLETVLFGFYQIYGESGIDNFLDSTTAWTAIKDDRAAPIYPRHVPPTGPASGIVEAAIGTVVQA